MQLLAVNTGALALLSTDATCLLANLLSMLELLALPSAGTTCRLARYTAAWLIANCACPRPAPLLGEYLGLHHPHCGEYPCQSPNKARMSPINSV